MVVLIVMGGALVLFGGALLLANRAGATAGAIEAVGLDPGPASAAMLLAAGVAMVVLGAYPLVVPWAKEGAAAVMSDAGGAPVFPVATLNVGGHVTPPATASDGG